MQHKCKKGDLYNTTLTSVQCNEGLALKLTLTETERWYRRLIRLALTVLFHLQFRFTCAYVTLLYPTIQSAHKVGYCPIIVFSHMEKYVVICSCRHYTLEGINHQTVTIWPKSAQVF